MNDEIWIRIGDYGTPEPMLLSSLDDYLIKKCFCIFLDNLEDLNASIDEKDKVLVVAKTQSILSDLSTLFEGTLSEAKEWAGNKNDTITYKKMDCLPMRKIGDVEAKNLLAEWGYSRNVNWGRLCTIAKEKSESKKHGQNI